MSYQWVTLSNGRSEMAWVSDGPPMSNEELAFWGFAIIVSVVLGIIGAAFGNTVLAVVMFGVPGVWLLRKAIRAFRTRRERWADPETPVIFGRHRRR